MGALVRDLEITAAQLTLPQAALLAGLIQNPSGYDPILDPADARNRRAQVVSRMLHYGDVTAAQAAAANRTAAAPAARRGAAAAARAAAVHRAAAARWT